MFVATSMTFKNDSAQADAVEEHISALNRLILSLHFLNECQDSGDI